ncbi:MULTISPECIES: 4-hydroxy-tetrahydrodipicolinate synthase [unclassified Wenzhouxiangella]|uniref:4-hydroxy-tetrahydrodipicolinate synthase n=1 Tax=unclassified Wenzhouxiangella TaxID=2613841 RepID=UPI000E32CD93|nr:MULTISPECIES: 4-hydroxy-tetrahydrodipicolinate synthase [unclassified Wenzhouxiangella]RFF26684.1 4-hydroxy-tetrahydrodipicolinate synthase [Wenzhouxiangella sp. 15181]RFP67642.1 4-hydroxy-tetrahydrodipicolinate synthase [Wenzhouxiangella sp. 15190]
MQVQGVYTALVTPLDESGEVNYDALGELLEKQIAAGVSGVVPMGTTGESPTMFNAEHDGVIRYAVEKVAGRVQVWAGTGSNNTQQAIRTTREAREAGADGALVVTPYYNKPSQAGLLRYFREIADGGGLPIIVYNIKGRTAVNVETETMAEIARIPEVIAVKEASGDIGQMGDVIDCLCHHGDDPFWVVSGDDALTLPLMSIGGHGVISVVSNLVPERMVALVDAAKKGDFETARAIHFELLPLFKAAFIETNPVPIKTAMNLCGLNAGDVRSPLAPLTEASRQRLEVILREMRLMD